jgi:polar amino acid transport system substrate-binding protein
MRQTITRRGALGLALAATTMVAGALPAQADELDDIKKAGKIRVAVAMGVPLFAFVDANLQPTGSDVETAKLIAKDLGVELELVQITNAARVPTIQTRKADILVANLGITPERKRAVDFSVPYATLNIIVAAPEAVKIADYKDLVGKRIGVTRATVNDQMVSQNAKGAEILRFEDDATLITAAVSGQVDIVSTQTAVLAAMNEKRGGKDPLKTKFVQQELNLGIALPQGETKLKDWLDGWVKSKMASGELNTLFKKFHDRDLPADLVQRG